MAELLEACRPASPSVSDIVRSHEHSLSSFEDPFPDFIPMTLSANFPRPGPLLGFTDENNEGSYYTYLQ